MKKITFKNVGWVILIALALYQIYSYSNEYLTIKNYQYGVKYNSHRVKSEIPIIENDMEPLKMPVDNYCGMIWINEKTTTNEKPLIHNIKIIDAFKEKGWEKENDKFSYFLNDTTDYILNIESKKSNSKIVFLFTLEKNDSRLQKIEDYQTKKYLKYPEKEVTKLEYVKIKKKWKIE
jgi:hypothetical protein